MLALVYFPASTGEILEMDAPSVLVAVGRRVLGADAVTGVLRVHGITLIQSRAQDQVLHVTEVGALVEVGVPRLGAGVALPNEKKVSERRENVDASVMVHYRSYPMQGA